MDNRAIGYIDSGLGGLTVVKAALAKLPNEAIYYLGDTARMPYGPRPQAEVVTFTRQMIQFLVDKQVKMVVIACNTATAAALPTMQQEFDIPIIGVIESGAATAATLTNNKIVGVIATQGTINSGSYVKALHQNNADLSVYQLAVPEFVTLVESGTTDSIEIQAVVDRNMANFPSSEIDTLILGCTHFPLLENSIQKGLGSKVKIVDAGAETITMVATQLKSLNIMHQESLQVDHHADRYYTTGDAAQFKMLGERWLERDDLQVSTLTIGAKKLYLK